MVVGAVVGKYAFTRPSGNPARPVAQAWTTALQAKDLNKMSSLFATGAVWEDGATGETFTGGPSAEVQGWTGVLPSVTVKQARILAMGDGVAAVAWTMFGTTPAHSTPISMPGISVLYIKDGRITRETDFYNTRKAYGS